MFVFHSLINQQYNYSLFNLQSMGTINSWNVTLLLVLLSLIFSVDQMQVKPQMPHFFIYLFIFLNVWFYSGVSDIMVRLHHIL